MIRPASPGSVFVLDAGDALANARHLAHRWPTAEMRHLSGQDRRRALSLITAAQHHLGVLERRLLGLSGGLTPTELYDPGTAPK